MKTGRRSDSESLRREARDRDMSRLHRKRPSMLSEFHGKHNSHREQDRDADSAHFRSYNRYAHDPLEYGSRFPPSSGGMHPKLKPDPRSKRLYSPMANHHSNYRAPYHQMSYSRIDSFNEGSIDEEIRAKRPCLSVDVSRRATDPPNSADSVASSNHMGGSPPTVTKGGGLSAYHLEDIDSDDEEALLKADEPKPPDMDVGRQSEQPTIKPSKEELLQMMEKVDRDISALENQIVSLQKKQAELEVGGKLSPPSPVTPSPKTPSPDVSSPSEESPVLPTTPDQQRQPVSKMSLIETIYSENKSKACAAQGLLQALGTHIPTQHGTPLYFQPSEAPFYHSNIASHRLFRPRLIEYLRRTKLSLHEKELSLCTRYDSLMADWERRVERMEGGAKKKARDLKNRELFEKTFPELKARREQQERFTRVDQRGFGVVRSDAELHELMYELSNKEAAPARYRRTHAMIPPMVLEERESRYFSTNGHVEDVMVLHRELKVTNIWTEEEKSTFREKFVYYPKNFEMIAKFLPKKSTPECIKYYYLSKKSENFKQLVRKANLKRKKALMKPPELSLSTSSLPTTPLSNRPPSLLPPPKREPSVEETKPDYGDWTEDNIVFLKEGLRKFGRAWGKVYREVGGSKTATQCKMFYDEYCKDLSLGLQESLLEHSRMKNAEKLHRKSQSRKPPSSDTKRKALPKPSPMQHSEGDSENTESATESDSNGGASESESTITDSGPDDVIADQPPPKRPRGSRKSHRSLMSPPVSAKTSEDVVDLFLTAAEALKNNISPDVALHDHTYSLPPSQLVNNMDLQGTSGLSLIAAAAAVVSPNLSRNAGSSKHAVVSPVRAPRGRPPNKYRGGGSNSTIKLSPTLLSPAGGSAANVLLSDIKNTAFRNRTRSAPTDRPKSSTIHLPRSGSTLARMSLSSSTGRSKNMVSSVAYKRGETPSLKSMIALQPSQGGNSAFEALVNVAVAAPPAELPKTPGVLTARNNMARKSTAGSRGSTSTPSPVNTLSGKLTLSRSNSNDSNNSSLNSGATATAYIDVSQAINILATLAQQNPGAVCTSHTISVYPGQPLIAQAGGASTIIGSIVSQGAAKPPIIGTNATSISATSNPASVSATVDTLLSHLTSGVGKGSPRNTPSPKPANRTKKVTKTESMKATSPATDAPVVNTNSDDLSNLKLLSSLVAAVAATQSSPSVSTAPVDVSTVSMPTMVQPTPSTQTQNSSSLSEHSHVSEHFNSNNCTSSEHHNNNDSVSSDDLPRSVVRPSPYPPTSRPPLEHRPPAVKASDMTASLASIIPSYNPSIGQQSSLLLYTRSRSFPQAVDTVGEDEDTLESATRGISELSKLLGTEGNGEGADSTLVAKKIHDVGTGGYSTESGEAATNGAPLSSLARVVINEFPDQDPSPSIKLNLSSLLESRGTVQHHTSSGGHGNSLSGEAPLNIDTQSR